LGAPALIQVKAKTQQQRQTVPMELGASIAALLAHCHVAINGHAVPVLSLGLAGLASGFTHCAAMCGPFMLSQAGNRLAALPVSDATVLRRVAGAAALPYQLGRATTYAALGAIVAAGFGGLVPTGVAPSAVALVLAATVATLMLRGAGQFALTVQASPLIRLVGRLAAPLVERPLGWTGFGLGLVLGLLPCGVVYSALLLAASTGSATAGMLGMLAFAVGTIPGLVAVGWLGHIALGRWRVHVQQLPGLILLLNALALLAINVRPILA
jgi:uncharacterized protein